MNVCMYVCVSIQYLGFFFFQLESDVSNEKEVFPKRELMEMKKKEESKKNWNVMESLVFLLYL